MWQPDPQNVWLPRPKAHRASQKVVAGEEIRIRRQFSGRMANDDEEGPPERWIRGSQKLRHACDVDFTRQGRRVGMRVPHADVVHGPTSAETPVSSHPGGTTDTADKASAHNVPR